MTSCCETDFNGFKSLRGFLAVLIVVGHFLAFFINEIYFIQLEIGCNGTLLGRLLRISYSICHPSMLWMPIPITYSLFPSKKGSRKCRTTIRTRGKPFYRVSHDLLITSHDFLVHPHDFLIVSDGFLVRSHNLLVFFDWISIQLDQKILGVGRKIMGTHQKNMGTYQKLMGINQ